MVLKSFTKPPFTELPLKKKLRVVHHYSAIRRILLQTAVGKRADWRHMLTMTGNPSPPCADASRTDAWWHNSTGARLPVRLPRAGCCVCSDRKYSHADRYPWQFSTDAAGFPGVMTFGAVYACAPPEIFSPDRRSSCQRVSLAIAIETRRQACIPILQVIYPITLSSGYSCFVYPSDNLNVLQML